MPKIARLPVESSQIASIGYDAPGRQLDIEFKSFKKPKPGEDPAPNSVYRYQNISQQMFADLMAAESKGKFVNENLKKLPGSYPYRKLTTEEAAQ